MAHRFRLKEEVRIVKDLSGKEPSVVGCDAMVLEHLTKKVKYPHYKVIIYGQGKAIGGVFEVDERELGYRLETK